MFTGLLSGVVELHEVEDRERGAIGWCILPVVRGNDFRGDFSFWKNSKDKNRRPISPEKTQIPTPETPPYDLCGNRVREMMMKQHRKTCWQKQVNGLRRRRQHDHLIISHHVRKQLVHAHEVSATIQVKAQRKLTRQPSSEPAPGDAPARRQRSSLSRHRSATILLSGLDSAALAANLREGGEGNDDDDSNEHHGNVEAERVPANISYGK